MSYVRSFSLNEFFQVGNAAVFSWFTIFEILTQLLLLMTHSFLIVLVISSCSMFSDAEIPLPNICL